ncbi:MAG TPA: glycosyl hydrolase family 28-related protein, partial [Armatimonadota bacterium]
MKMYPLLMATLLLLLLGSTSSVLAHNGWIDVTTAPYNADPTGVNDSTTAIQSAINAGSDGATIYFPRGAYKITSTLICDKRGQTFRGIGMAPYGSELFWAGAAGGWIAEVNYWDNSFEYLMFTGATKSSNGLRLRGNAAPTTKTNKRTMFMRVWVRNCNIGVSFEQAAGGGLTQCDAAAFYSCTFSDSNIGVNINSCDADYEAFYSCEFSACTTAGLQMLWGGEVEMNSTIFGNCGMDISIPPGSNGGETLSLHAIQGESQTSGIMLDLQAHCAVSLSDSIINGDVQVATGCPFVSTNNFYHDGDLKVVGHDQAVYEFGDRYLNASYLDSGINNRRFNLDTTGLNLEKNELYIKPATTGLVPLTIQTDWGQGANKFQLINPLGSVDFAIDKNNWFRPWQSLIIKGQDTTTGTSLSVFSGSATSPASQISLVGLDTSTNAPYMIVQMNAG